MWDHSQNPENGKKLLNNYLLSEHGPISSLNEADILKNEKTTVFNYMIKCFHNTHPLGGQLSLYGQLSQ